MSAGMEVLLMFLWDDGLLLVNVVEGSDRCEMMMEGIQGMLRYRLRAIKIPITHKNIVTHRNRKEYIIKISLTITAQHR